MSPIALFEDAVDQFRYQDTIISDALRGAAPQIQAIIFGESESTHPVVTLYHAWIANHEFPAAFPTKFNFPVFPAHLSLKEEFQFSIKRMV